MKNAIRTQVAAAMMVLAPMAATVVTQPVAAQQRVAAPAIQSLAMESDAGLRPGATLVFTLVATPDADAATVMLGGSGPRVNLREREPGTYIGSYVVRQSDRIDPRQRMAVRLGYGQQVLALNYDYPAQVAGVAAPPPPAAPAGPAIERFVMRGSATPGEELIFRLVGAPGARATVEIPGMARPLPMTEERPGVYEAEYTVRRRDNPAAFPRAIGRLQSGTQVTTARVDVRGERWDNNEPPRAGGGGDTRPPVVVAVTPAEGERVGDRGRVHVSAKLTDEGSGVDPASVRLRIDGRDVTADTRMRDDEVHYRDDLPPGRHTAEVTLRDKAGNAATKTWNFVVVDRERAQNLELRVTSHAEGAAIPVNGEVMLEGRTAPNATVRVQVEALTSVGGLLNLTQPVADLTVQADSSGRFAVRIPPRGLPIPGSRVEVRLTATSGNQVVESRLMLQTTRG